MHDLRVWENSEIECQNFSQYCDISKNSFKYDGLPMLAFLPVYENTQ